MSYACRVWFGLVVLSLSLSSPIWAQFQIQGSTLSPAPATDEATLRRMTEEYGLAIVAGNLESLRTFWNPQSPNLAARVRYYRNLFSATRVEFIRSTVTRLEITGDKAVSHLTTDERRLDKKTGAPIYTHDTFHGACRSIEWLKTGAEWKIEREFLVQDELAAKLQATASEQERDTLLEKKKIFVTDTLVVSLTLRGNQLIARAEYDAALHGLQVQRAVAEKLGDPAGMAGFWLNMGLLQRAQDDYEQALQMLGKALALYEAAGLKRGMALALENLSNVHRLLGNHRQAFAYAQRSLRLCEEGQFRRGTADALTELAYIYGIQNNAEQALTHLERALVIAEELGDVILIAMLRHEVAIQYEDMGAPERALEIYLALQKQTAGDQGGTAM